MYHRIFSILYLLLRLGTGIVKRFLSIDDEHETVFSYYERGVPDKKHPSIVFIHGFSGEKETWLDLVKKVNKKYHCIMVDLPCHGETTGLFNNDHRVEIFVEKLKLFFDRLNMTKPFCIVGTSMGAAVVASFTVKYPEYVKMMCLLAPPPCQEYESELIGRVRRGSIHLLLPHTLEQFHAAIEVLVVKNDVPKFFLDMMFRARLPYIDIQKKLIQSIFEHEYKHLNTYYEQLKSISRPILILCGRQDTICTVESMKYFSEIIPHAEMEIFDNCGHLMSHDKSKECAASIMNFIRHHSQKA